MYKYHEKSRAGPTFGCGCPRSFRESVFGPARDPGGSGAPGRGGWAGGELRGAAKLAQKKNQSLCPFRPVAQRRGAESEVDAVNCHSLKVPQADVGQSPPQAALPRAQAAQCLFALVAWFANAARNARRCSRRVTAAPLKRPASKTQQLSKSSRKRAAMCLPWATAGAPLQKVESGLIALRGARVRTPLCRNWPRARGPIGFQGSPSYLPKQAKLRDFSYAMIRPMCRV